MRPNRNMASRPRKDIGVFLKGGGAGGREPWGEKKGHRYERFGSRGKMTIDRIIPKENANPGKNWRKKEPGESTAISRKEKRENRLPRRLDCQKLGEGEKNVWFRRKKEEAVLPSPVERRKTGGEKKALREGRKAAAFQEKKEGGICSITHRHGEEVERKDA